MAATYEIREDNKGLVVTSRRSKERGMRILGFAATVLFFWVVYRYAAGQRGIWLCGVVVILVGQLVEMFRNATAELRVTNLEFTARGYFGASYRPDRIPRADVIRMEYREGRGGGPYSSYQPEGLYVERKWKASCMLPFIDESQTTAIIDAIYRRFPDMPLATDDRPLSIFGDKFISLGLSESGK